MDPAEEVEKVDVLLASFHRQDVMFFMSELHAEQIVPVN